jgi:tripartite-type tricarboxylate transporter receptor subunit TctC
VNIRASYLLAAAAAATLAFGASAQDFPTKPIRIVVPYAAGGSDAQLRPLTQCFQSNLGQPVLVENVPGANGAVGASQVARATGDGHTLLFLNTAAMTLAPKLGQIPYAPGDFTPILQLIWRPLTLAVRKDAPFQTLNDLVAFAKKSPEKLTFGSAGVNSTSHMAMEAFLTRAIGETKSKIVHVPYTGEVPTIAALLSGTVDMAITTAQSIVPQVEGGRLTMLASTGKVRFSLTPNVATFLELGIPEVDVIARNGLYSPKGTPAAVNDKLSAVFESCAKDKAYIDMMKKTFNDVIFIPQKPFMESLAEEDKFYASLVQAMGLKK